MPSKPSIPEKPGNPGKPNTPTPSEDVVPDTSPQTGDYGVTSYVLVFTLAGLVYIHIKRKKEENK